VQRVKRCFECVTSHQSHFPFNPQVPSRASALATDCEVEVFADPKNSMTELLQNEALGIHLSFSRGTITQTHRVLQGKPSNRSSTPSMEWSTVCTVSLPHQRILWVSLPSRATPTGILRFTDDPPHQGNVTYGTLGSGVPTSRGF
jgi:hypothetical protein